MTSVAELSRQMDRERRDLSRNLTELKTRAESALDWRDQVQKHPALVSAAALGAGMLLAQLGGSGRSRPRRRFRTMSAGQEPARRHDVLDVVGDALKATAATAVAGMLSEFIPGFREEHDKRRG
jgi:hypothetical protein